MFRKFLSYFSPINILTQKSTINKSIEVTWNNGELVLDTENTNYSYGSLQRILKKGLVEVGFEKIREFEKILILGVAAGSVIKTLIDEINFEGTIIGVELDPEIIEIANKYFDLQKFENLKIIIDNAESFVKIHTYVYDLIIIDIFQDNFMPEFLFDINFINNIKIIFSENGFVIFNTMVLNKSDENRNLKFLENFSSNEFSVTKISKLEKFNELLIIKKI